MSVLTEGLDLPTTAAGVERAAIWLAAVSGGLAAFLYIVKKLRQGWKALKAGWAITRRRFDALEALIQHELNPNSGGSMYDAIHRLDDTTRQNTARLDHLESHLGTLADAQACIWPAIEAVANAEPPRKESTR